MSRKRTCPYCKIEYRSSCCPICREERLCTQNTKIPAFEDDDIETFDDDDYFDGDEYYGEFDDRLRGGMSLAFR